MTAFLLKRLAVEIVDGRSGRNAAVISPSQCKKVARFLEAHPSITTLDLGVFTSSLHHPDFNAIAGAFAAQMKGRLVVHVGPKVKTTALAEFGGTPGIDVALIAASRASSERTDATGTKVVDPPPVVDEGWLIAGTKGDLFPCHHFYKANKAIGRLSTIGIESDGTLPNLSEIKRRIHSAAADDPMLACQGCQSAFGGTRSNDGFLRYWSVAEPAASPAAKGGKQPELRRELKSDELLRIDLGCGTAKQPGFIGIDRFALPGVDIVSDIDRAIPLADNSVRHVIASHSFEHLANLQATMNEVNRICADRAIVTIISPYDATRLNRANPYHLQPFNEHTPRFFTNEPETVVDIAEYDFPHAPFWGLASSDHSDWTADFRCLKIEFTYMPSYRHLNEATKRELRRSLSDVCDQMAIHLLVVKSPISREELLRLSQHDFLVTPAFEARRALETQPGAPTVFSTLADTPGRLAEIESSLSQQREQLDADRGILLEKMSRIESELGRDHEEASGLRQTLVHLERQLLNEHEGAAGIRAQLAQIEIQLQQGYETTRRLGEQMANAERQLEADYARSLVYSDQLVEFERRQQDDRVRAAADRENIAAIERLLHDEMSHAGTLQDQIATIENHLAAERERAGQLLETLAQFDRQLVDERSEAAVLRERLGRIEVELSAERQRADALQEQSATIERQLLKEHSANDVLREQSAQIELQLGKERERADAFREQLAQFERQLSKEHSDADDLRERAAQIEMQLIGEHERAGELREAVARTERDIVNERAKTDALREQHARMAQELGEERDRISAMRRQIEQIERNLSQQHEDAHLARGRADRLEKALAEEAASLREALQTLEAAHIERQQRLGHEMERQASALGRLEQALTEKADTLGRRITAVNAAMTREMTLNRVAEERRSTQVIELLRASEGASYFTVAHVVGLMPAGPALENAARVSRLFLTRTALAALSFDWPSVARNRRYRKIATQLSRSALFDRVWYAQVRPDVSNDNDLFQHFITYGLPENTPPNPLFAPDWYKSTYPDLAAADIIPFEHYLMHGRQEDRNPHPLFDVAYYRSTIPDGRAIDDPLSHFLRGDGGAEANPNPMFSGSFYRHIMPVPLNSRTNPLLHYILAGEKLHLDPHPLFNIEYYLRHAPQARKHAGGALGDFLQYGAADASRVPVPLFDPMFYRKQRPGLEDRNLNPLIHYALWGADELLDPHPQFSTAYYVKQNPDVAASGMNPLAHFVRYGKWEGRRPHPDTAAEDVSFDRPSPVNR